ncbi:MAG: 4Fe-4S binding protein, partial [Firmicutes bacterium]|nr:4Fe-4S binding protein [Bacillota bacterium]
AGAIFIPRCFCRYLCPLGAFYSLFSRFALYRMELDASSCIGCGKCEEACPMAVRVTQELETSPECIRCGRCKAACPAGAICAGFEIPGVKKKENAEF